jgi:hypothetical protein
MKDLQSVHLRKTNLTLKSDDSIDVTDPDTKKGK